MSEASWWSTSEPWIQVVSNASVTLSAHTLPPTGLIYSARMAGREMSGTDEVFTQFYEHLRLPAYFGWNWDALRDCLKDLNNWIEATHFVLTIDDANYVLSESSEEQIFFFRALSDAAKYWADKPEFSHTPKVTFRVVLLCSPKAASDMSAELHG